MVAVAGWGRSEVADGFGSASDLHRSRANLVRSAACRLSIPLDLVRSPLGHPHEQRQADRHAVGFG